MSGKQGKEVAVFSINDLKNLVSDSISQIISILWADFSVNLRFEKVRKFSSLQVKDSNEVFYVSSPDPSQHLYTEALASFVQKLPLCSDRPEQLDYSYSVAAIFRERRFGDIAVSTSNATS